MDFNFEKPRFPSAEMEQQERDQKIKEVLDSGHWEPTKGIEIGELRGGKIVKTQGLEGADYSYSASTPRPGSWNRNGNVIALMGERGEVWITPASEEMLKRLQGSGLEKDEHIGVPMSHLEVPVHPDIRARWDEAVQEAARKDKITREKRAPEGPGNQSV